MKILTDIFGNRLKFMRADLIVVVVSAYNNK